MGPLAGVKIIEMKGIGPGPYAGMLFADLGAEVIVVERSRKPSGIALPSSSDVHSRGKKSIALNLKSAAGVEALMRLIEGADMFFEGYRPGVAERLGFGPEACLARNPKLIYGRMTGWGQTGPLAKSAGHDINYIAIAGALAAIGGEDKPVPPLNLVGDFAAGSLFLVMGMLAALFEAQKSAKGQVIDAAISDGTANLMSMFYSYHALGAWSTKRNNNMFDGAAHFYDSYETSDAKFIAIGSIEPQFYALLLQTAGLDKEVFAEQMNQHKWPELKAQLVEVFKTKTRDQWCDLMEGTDICFAPVLDFTEAPRHRHNVARKAFVEINGLTQPAPAPVFSRSVCDTPTAGHDEGSDTEQVLADWGFSDEAVAKLKSEGALPE